MAVYPILRLSLCGFILLTLALPGFTQSAAPAQPDLTKLRAQAKNSGFLLTMAQLQAPVPPPSQNAAPIYVMLTQKLKSQPIQKADELAETIGTNDAPPSTADLASARTALAHRSDLLQLVHQAAIKPRCVFVRSWTQPDSTKILFPEYASLRTAARLLAGESLAMAAQGKGVAAVNNEALSFQIGRQAESDHLLISYLVHVAIDSITLHNLRNILYVSKGDPKVALAVQRVMQRNWRASLLGPIWQSELAMEIGFIDMLRNAGPGGIAGVIGNLEGPSPQQIAAMSHTTAADYKKTLDENETVLLDRVSRIATASELPFLKSDPALRAIDGEAKADHGTGHFAVAVVLPATEVIAQKQAQIVALAQATRAGAAVLCYKGDHGSPPDSLEQAIAPIPTDPFNGHALSYKREGDGFVIYSVGPDGKFDGGTTTIQPDPKQVVFRYPCPAYEIHK